MNDREYITIPRENDDGSFHRWEAWSEWEESDDVIEGHGPSMEAAVADLAIKTGKVIGMRDVRVWDHDPAQMPSGQRLRATLLKSDLAKLKGPRGLN